MIRSNFHTHTTYCDGKNTPEELVQAAIGLGFTQLGFSGHSYTEFDPRWCMSREGTAAYCREVRRLKEKYAGQIEILLGIEQDYYSCQPVADYDYVIGSVHYIKKDGAYLPLDESRQLFEDHVARHYNGDVYGLIEDYYGTVADLYRRTGCQIIGHFDLVNKFNGDGSLFDPDHPRYRLGAERALSALADAPAAIEINTGAMARGYCADPYPSEPLLRQLWRQGGRIVISSDCHDCAMLDYGFRRAEMLARQCGFQEHTVISRGNMRSISF